MENLSGVIRLGDTVYCPVADFTSCGFLIEEIKVRKLFPPNGNPAGFPKVIWSYGDISDYKKKWQNDEILKSKIYYHGYVTLTLEDCISRLEKYRKEFIENYTETKELAVFEVQYLKDLLKEKQESSKFEIRNANKKIAMLKNLSISDDLKRKNIIE